MSIPINVTDQSKRMAWSLGEVAGLLGVSERFLRDEVKSGKLEVVRRGRRRVLVPASSLENYLRIDRTPTT
jgi:excisionase family DNA binding protein